MVSTSWTDPVKLFMMTMLFPKLLLGVEPCVCLDRKLKTSTVKFVESMEHSLRGNADDVILVSCDINVHKSILQTFNFRFRLDF